MRFPFFTLFLIPLGIFGQEIPAVFNARYYYQNADTLYPYVLPNKDKKIKLWASKNELLMVDSTTNKISVQHGFDTILNVTKTTFTNPFYIRATEVTNLEYKSFATEIKAPSYLPDTAVWNEKDEESVHPFAFYYYQHKAYNNYPVVGVTHWQAEQFCKWKTDKLNAELRQNGITNYTAIVSLPSDAEMNAAFKKYIHGWLISNENKCGYNAENEYLSYVFGCKSFRCNFHSMRTIRGAELKPTLDKSWQAFGFTLTPVKSYQNSMGLYNLLGNAEEWTSTSADGRLFNNIEYIYNTSGKIIKNSQTRIDSVSLSKHLHQSSVMKGYFAVKGGSWMDDIYYLQPEALKFHSASYRSKSLGFRYVVKLHKVK